MRRAEVLKKNKAPTVQPAQPNCLTRRSNAQRRREGCVVERAAMLMMAMMMGVRNQSRPSKLQVEEEAEEGNLVRWFQAHPTVRTAGVSFSHIGNRIGSLPAEALS